MRLIHTVWLLGISGVMMHGLDQFFARLLVKPDKPVHRIRIKTTGSTREQFWQRIYETTDLVCCKRSIQDETPQQRTIFVAKLITRQNSMILGKEVSPMLFSTLQRLHTQQHNNRSS